MRVVVNSWGLLSRTQKRSITLLSVGKILANSLDVAAIALLGLVASVAVGAVESIVGLQRFETRTQLIISLGAGAILFLGKTVLSLWLTRLTVLYLAEVETAFSTRVAKYLFGNSLTGLASRTREDTEWAVLRSTQIAFSSILSATVTLVADTTLTIMIVGFLFLTDWKLALATILYFGAILAIFQLVSRKTLSGAGEDFSSGSVQVSNTISDMTNAFRELTVFGVMPIFLSKLAAARAKAARGQAIHILMGAIPRLVVELGLIFGALGLVSFQVLRGDSPGSEVAVLGIFLLGSLRMMSALLPMHRAFVQFRFDGPAALSAQKLIAEMNRNARDKRSQLNSSNAPEIEFHDRGSAVSLSSVSFSYPSDSGRRPAVNELTLSIAPGEFVALVGPSGAGKSTLADLILGLHQPNTGELLVDGVDPARMTENTVGRSAYVPQKPGLIAGRFDQNIAIGVPDDKIDPDRIWGAIHKAGLTAAMQSVQEGPKALVGNHLDALSGGELQRLGLARALYHEPRLLVLDEVTSGLDAETEAEITETLAQLRGKTTLIVIAHRMKTIEAADKIFVLENGKLVSSGLFHELKKSEPIVRRYVELSEIRDTPS